MGATQAPTAAQRPLVVDLDGTLLRTDLLAESACALVGRSPLNAARLVVWLARGKAFLKRRIAERADVDPSLLPYDEAVLERIRKARGEGRPVYLASASDERYVQAVARHVGLFQGWFGSDGEVNLRGEAKAARLVAEFGERGFDYLADSSVDLPVWRRAHTALVLSTSDTLARRAAEAGARVERLSPPPRGLGTWLRLLRPHQWAKNALVAVAMITSHSFTVPAAIDVLLAFVAFSLCASSVYVLNDLVDLRADRTHPGKRRRPFASGAVPLAAGAIVAPFLLAAGAAAALAVSVRFAAVLGLYYALTLAYSFVLKRKMLVDVITLAGLYTIRVIAGAVAIDVETSQWILAFSMFIFLSLALVKRYTELATRLDAGLPDPTNRNYRVSDLPVILSLAAAAGYSAVIVFSLYLASDAVTALYRWPEVLWLAVPLLVYWISRLLMMVHRRMVHEDPILFALPRPRQPARRGAAPRADDVGLPRAEPDGARRGPRPATGRRANPAARSGHLERPGIPAYGPLLPVAEIAQQRRRRRAQAEEHVLDHRGARAHRGEEALEVVEPVVVAVRCPVDVACRVGEVRVLRGLLVPVPRERRPPRDGHRAAAELHEPLVADEAEARLAPLARDAAVDEVHLQRQVEGRRPCRGRGSRTPRPSRPGSRGRPSSSAGRPSRRRATGRGHR